MKFLKFEVVGFFQLLEKNRRKKRSPSQKINNILMYSKMESDTFDASSMARHRDVKSWLSARSFVSSTRESQLIDHTIRMELYGHSVQKVWSCKLNFDATWCITYILVLWRVDSGSSSRKERENNTQKSTRKHEKNTEQTSIRPVIIGFFSAFILRLSYTSIFFQAPLHLLPALVCLTMR